MCYEYTVEVIMKLWNRVNRQAQIDLPHIANASSAILESEQQNRQL